MEKGAKDHFGRVYASVMRNKNIPTTAKAIYSYLAVLCGSSDECFPGVDTIIADLNIDRGTFYKYLNILVAAGIVEKKQSSFQNGRFSHAVYRLIRDDEPCMKYPDTGVPVDGKTTQSEGEFTNFPCTEFSPSKEKKNKNISLMKCQNVVDLYNSICKSLPRVVKLSESRKRAIHARFSSGYTLDDFKKLFETAESSTFLRGNNDRNWKADFDWLIKDGNMAKALEGKYADRQPEGGFRDGKSGTTGLVLFR